MKRPAIPKMKIPAYDLNTLVTEFKNLDSQDPGLWPILPKIIILVTILLLAIAAGWWFGWRDQMDQLDSEVQQEEKLKQEWLDKKRQAVNLEEYEKQLAEINRSFGALLKQLPNASEMEALLIDINQAGLGRGMQFELYKPGAEVQKDFYAELPITIKVIGTYHDIGAFTGDIAKLSRIVTLNDIDLVPGKDSSGLVLQAVAKTFRYLDDAELARQRKEKQEKEKAGQKAASGGNK